MSRDVVMTNDLVEDIALLGASPAESRPTPRRRQLAYLSEIEEKSIEWLERPIWQRGAFHLLTGKKGVGKGTTLANLAARVTTGQLGPTGNVLLISSEDSAAIDLRPRARAAGADLDRIAIWTGDFLLPRDIPLLRELAESMGGVECLGIDPVANHIGSRDSNQEMIREAIAPLNDLADELDCLLIGVRHLTEKGNPHGAIASILGSSAWAQVPRSVIAIAEDDEDDMTFHAQVVAGNRGPRSAGFTFRIDLIDVGLKEPVTKATIIGGTLKDVNTLLGVEKQSKSGLARERILDLLDEAGQMESDTLDARVAQETGLAAGTVKNQRMKLKDDGLIALRADKDERGKVVRWNAYRTQAPRPTRALDNPEHVSQPPPPENGLVTPEHGHSPTHNKTCSGLVSNNQSTHLNARALDTWTGSTPVLPAPRPDDIPF
jgi:hypothetical protein